jgi:DNA-binding GntR family transcriptional regulator
MDAALDALKRAIRSNDRAAIVDLDLQFHGLSVDALGSPRLSAFYSNIISELRLALFVLDKLEGDWRDWIVDHAEIMNALRSGRRKECVKLIEQHLREACQRLLRIAEGSPALD